MAGISPNPTLSLRRIHGIQCCSGAPGNEKWSRVGTKSKTPRILKFAVSGVTELLRLFSFSSKDSLDRVSCEERDEISVSGIDDVVMILMGDYENAYFVTGIFTSAIYAEDCLFEDPTIRFRGTDLYARNLKLLVPFFDSPSIGLQNIEKGVNSETKFVLAKWKLRTYLKFPWRPFISIDGSTIYEINDEFKVVRHAESWNVSALEAIGQIFTPSFGKPAI
ncbi:hypothetical protein P3X46_005454 [Hevea brasiliensis]|uniref:Uncharacterized protein n=1 Tax=Hevea brasiliensis TaxID=3981 RepID=A0ABQ9N005_HEVBR|nr:uncharacterized protein LOC110662592 isoform X4 [Hevea brasiliensis]KAJ9185872.1 hypothetical protein P3X46_005454 [Hevea brasiliensis]